MDAQVVSVCIVLKRTPVRHTFGVLVFCSPRTQTVLRICGAWRRCGGACRRPVSVPHFPQQRLSFVMRMAQAVVILEAGHCCRRTFLLLQGASARICRLASGHDSQRCSPLHTVRDPVPVDSCLQRLQEMEHLFPRTIK